MLKLRGSQPTFVEKAIATLKSSSVRKQVMVAPVAYGKSICIASIVAGLDGPCIVLQPNKELLEQNYGKYVSYGNTASIFSASLNSKELGHVTYATIGSIKSHVPAVKKLKVKYVIIDECHIATGTSGTTAKFIKAIGVKNVLGVTATPVLLQPTFDGTMLKMMNRSQKNMFTGLDHVVQIQELVEAGYWSKLEYDLRITHVPHLQYNTSGTDFTQLSLDKHYVESETEANCIKAIKDLRKEGRKSILVFVPSVQAAFDLSAKVKGSAVVHGGTKKPERNQIISDFKNLKIDVVINVNVLTTGFDHPQLDSIILARPTASISLYYQIMGRGTRIHPDKENTKIVDLSGNVTNFGPIESLNYEYIDGYGWGMFTNENCLTHNPIKDQKERPTKEVLRANATKQLIEENKTFHDKEIWFGKHKGKKLGTIPRSYLGFMRDNFSFDTSRMISLKIAIDKVLQS